MLQQPQYDHRIIADEQTAFRLFTPEYMLLPSPQHHDPLSLIKIHYRRPELSREEFHQRLLDHHTALVIAQPATHTYVRGYAQLHNIGSTQQPDPEGSPIDAISVLAFASVNDVEDYITTDDYQAIEADKTTFIDLARSELWTGLKYSFINPPTARAGYPPLG